MELTIRNIKENADGSADLELVMDEQTKLWLINYAFINILTVALDDVKELNERDFEVTIDTGEKDE
jgi:hypothetical protein